jgi:hypothetical protein
MEVVELVVASDYDSMLLLRGPSQLGQASKRYRIAQSKFPSFDFSGESVKEEVGGAGQDTCWHRSRQPDPSIGRGRSGSWPRRHLFTTTHERRRIFGHVRREVDPLLVRYSIYWI